MQVKGTRGDAWFINLSQFDNSSDQFNHKTTVLVPDA